MSVGYSKKNSSAVALGAIAVITASVFLYIRARGRTDEPTGSPDEIGDQRYSVICDECGATYDWSAAQFAEAFSRAAAPGNLACTRCGATRAHLALHDEPTEPIDLPPEIANDPDKIREMARERQMRFQALHEQYSDRTVISDPVRRKQLDEEIESVRRELAGLVKRWSDLQAESAKPRSDR
jgi:hypothetical protein